LPGRASLFGEEQAFAHSAREFEFGRAVRLMIDFPRRYNVG
jgi:hypothetical protein